MSVSQINKAIRDFSSSLFNQLLEGNLKCYQVKFKECGNLDGNFESVFSHKGIYMFTLEKGRNKAVSYVGKSESDARLRQHLTGKNKNGTPLKDSVSTKHQLLKKAIKAGFIVKVYLYSDPSLQKSSLSCIELELLEMAQENFESVFPQELPWIKRVG